MEHVLPPLLNCLSTIHFPPLASPPLPPLLPSPSSPVLPFTLKATVCAHFRGWNLLKDCCLCHTRPFTRQLCHTRPDGAVVPHQADCLCLCHTRPFTRPPAWEIAVWVCRAAPASALSVCLSFNPSLAAFCATPGQMAQLCHTRPTACVCATSGHSHHHQHGRSRVWVCRAAPASALSVCVSFAS